MDWTSAMGDHSLVLSHGPEGSRSPELACALNPQSRRRAPTPACFGRRSPDRVRSRSVSFEVDRSLSVSPHVDVDAALALEDRPAEALEVPPVKTEPLLLARPERRDGEDRVLLW